MKMRYQTQMNVLLIVTLLLSGCIDLPSVSEVDKFRVLAVTAEPPEISPGEGVSLEVLYADPKGKDREVEFAWIPCAGYVHSSEGLSTCEMITEPVVQTASEEGYRFEIPYTPPNIMELDVLEQGFMKVTFIVLMCAGGTLPAPDKYEAERDVLDVNTLCKGGDALSAYKLVTISESENPQTNPTLARLTADKKKVEDATEDAPYEIKCKESQGCGTEVTLNAFFTKDSRQSYDVIEFDESVVEKEERIYVSWFVSGGSVSIERGGPKDDGPRIGPYETKWDVDKPGRYTLWVVGHDIRGGTTWETYEFEFLKK